MTYMYDCMYTGTYEVFHNYIHKTTKKIKFPVKYNNSAYNNTASLVSIAIQRGNAICFSNSFCTSVEAT